VKSKNYYHVRYGSFATLYMADVHEEMVKRVLILGEKYFSEK
jgi:hypothetical protein